MSVAAVRTEGEVLDGCVVWTCEHASPRIPPGFSVRPEDRRWLRTHWGHDRGAAALVRALQARMGGPAVFSNFSRLLIDANRSPHHPDLFRTRVEGHVLAHNVDVHPVERARRVEQLHVPFHAAVDDVVGQRVAAGVPTFLFSVHTFTSLYEGHPRSVELGVLFDECDEGAAGALLAGLWEEPGLEVAPNSPWSGMDGLIYSVARHGAAHGRTYLELEVRDDLLTGRDDGGPDDPVPLDVAGVGRIADVVARALGPVVERWAR